MKDAFSVKLWSLKQWTWNTITHLFLFQVITNGVIPVTSFPLWLEAVGTLTDLKGAVMEHDTVRGFFKMCLSRSVAKADILQTRQFF